MKTKILTVLLCISLLFTLAGCGIFNNANDDNDTSIDNAVEDDGNGGSKQTNKKTEGVIKGETADLGGDNESFGEKIEDTGMYDGFFEGESTDIVVEWVSGTKNAVKLEGTTLTFTSLSEDSVYSVSGKLNGNIVIDVGDNYKLDVELCGFSLVSDSVNPITVKSGSEVAVQAKKDTKNYIYDTRKAIDSTNTALYSGAIHSEVDLEIGGKGMLDVVSENNNGIHSKDDLQVKNLTLRVACIDNALKGNDSVEITGANTTLIASGGDCIKTTSSDVSDKNNQRGTVTIAGGTHNLYAACDGIDAAYDVVIDDDTTVLGIFTDKYSNYSGEVAANSSATNYIRFTSNKYYYSVQYYNSDTDSVFVNAEYHSKVSNGKTTYHYYTYPKMSGYSKMRVFVYESESQLGQAENKLMSTDYLTPNTTSDTFALTKSGTKWSYSWTNYTTQIQSGGFGGTGGRPGGGGGFGGMDGNSDKGDHSTKGIKASNEIIINAGTVGIKSYDDAIHANNDTALENGKTPLGNVTVNGGTITAYSNDDGLHADGTLSIKSGTVSVTNSYEGIEGTVVNISGGYVSVISKDDGINGTGTGNVINVSGGSLYVYAGGDGVDAGSDMRSDAKITFTGGDTVIISTSGGNSAIDTNSGYTQSGSARVFAAMPTDAMTNEATHGTSVGKTVNNKISLTENGYVTVTVGSETVLTVKMPKTMTAYAIYIGSNNASIKTASSSNAAFDSNGVSWN